MEFGTGSDDQFHLELLDKLYSFSQSKQFCDTVLVTNNDSGAKQSFWAHSAVLAAASDLLYAKLMKLSKSSAQSRYRYCIPLDDCDPMAVEIVIQFLYTGRLVAPSTFCDQKEMSKIVAVCQSLGVSLEKLNGLKLTVKHGDVQLQSESDNAQMNASDENSDVHRTVAISKSHLLAGNDHVTAAKQTKTKPEVRGQVEKLGLPPRRRGRPRKSNADAAVVKSDAQPDPAEDQDEDIKPNLDLLENIIAADNEKPKDSESSTQGSSLVLEEANLDDGSSTEEEDVPGVVDETVPATESSSHSSRLNKTESKLSTKLSSKLGHGGIKAGTRRLGSSHLCTHCGHIFRTPSRLYYHVSRCASSQFTCPHCGIKCRSVVARRRHIRENHGFPCPTCGKTFRSPRHLRSHKQSHAVERRYKCTQCTDVAYRHRSTLRRHIATVHGSAQPYICELCGRSFPLAGHLRAHLYMHNQPFACEQCGKRFGQKARLQEHALSCGATNEDERRPFTCDICGARFTIRKNMERHRRDHIDGPLTCADCGRTYQHYISLYAHRREHHTPGGGFQDPRNCCPICSKQFRNNKALRLHSKTHEAGRQVRRRGPKRRKETASEEPAAPVLKGPHICPDCGRGFAFRRLLCLHAAVHRTRDIVAKCPDCGKGFTHIRYLAVHSAVHRSEVLTCTICSQMFRQHWKLTAHMKHKHPSCAVEEINPEQIPIMMNS